MTRNKFHEYKVGNKRTIWARIQTIYVGFITAILPTWSDKIPNMRHPSEAENVCIYCNTCFLDESQLTYNV